MEENLAQLHAKLEADPTLAGKLFALETPEEVQSLLKEQGLEFSLDEIHTFKDALVKAAARQNSGELSDEDLEDVAGGSFKREAQQLYNYVGNYIKIGGHRW